MKGGNYLRVKPVRKTDVKEKRYEVLGTEEDGSVLRTGTVLNQRTLDSLELKTAVTIVQC